MHTFFCLELHYLPVRVWLSWRQEWPAKLSYLHVDLPYVVFRIRRGLMVTGNMAS